MARSKQTELELKPDRDELVPEHPATSAWRRRLVSILEPHRAAATALLRDRGCLLGSEELEDLELRDVPATYYEMQILLAEIKEYETHQH